MDIKKYTFYESEEKTIIDQFQTTFGGEKNGNQLLAKTKTVDLNLYHFDFLGGLSFYQNNLTFKKDNQIQTIGNPDKSSIVMRFDYEGNIFESIDGNSTQNAGMQLYSNSNSYTLENKKDKNYKWFTIRISKEIITSEFKILLPLIELLESQSSNWLIYDLIPMEVFLYLKDIFELDHNVSELYRKRIILSRGIECLGVFADRLMQRAPIHSFKIHPDDLKMLIKIKDKVLSDLQKTPTIEEISKIYGYSPSKFKRDFKKVFGKSFYKFFIEYKLEKAKQLLLNNKLTVTEISRIVGYKSLAKFSYAFKHQYGVSPKELK